MFCTTTVMKEFFYKCVQFYFILLNIYECNTQKMSKGYTSAHSTERIIVLEKFPFQVIFYFVKIILNTVNTVSYALNKIVHVYKFKLMLKTLKLRI